MGGSGRYKDGNYGRGRETDLGTQRVHAAKGDEMRRQLAAVVLLMTAWTSAVHADTIRAESVAYADVSAAVAEVRPGDTVLVPEGTATWDTTLNVHKGITLKGAGMDRTTIVCGFREVRTPCLLNYTPASPELNEPFRVTGFAFDGGAVLMGNGSTTHLIDRVRVDHNKFTSCTYYTIRFTGLVYGLVDHNHLISCRAVFRPLGRNDASWKFPLELGSRNYMYIESNRLSKCGIVVGSGWGARWVLRHNTVDEHQSFNILDAHGNLPNSGRPDGLRGVVACEIYENVLANHAKLSSGMRFHDIRGGTCIMFNNRVGPDARVPTRSPGILLREEDCHPRQILKDTYPGYDPVKDTYIWNNTVTTTGKPVSVRVEDNSKDMIKLGRDYWLDRPDRSFYIPYPYPHPVTLLGVQEPEAGTALLRHFDEAGGGVSLVPGKFGQAGRFGEGQGRLQCVVDDLSGGQGVLCAWVKFDELAGEQVLCAARGSGDGLRLALVAQDGRPEVRLEIYEVENEAWHSVGADVGAWQPGQWHHAAAYWNAEFGVMRICLDGQLAATGTLGFEPEFGSVTVSIGADGEDLRRLHGALDELMIMNVASGAGMAPADEP